MTKVFESGKQAALEGKTVSDCPHTNLDYFTVHRKHWWMKGFNEGISSCGEQQSSQDKT